LKFVYSSIFLLICSLNLFAQILPSSQLNKVILTVEAFLNNEITPYNEYVIISVHEWNKRYFHGYSPVHQSFYILTYPYKEIFNLNIMADNMIQISISPDNNSIIVVTKYQNRNYGFFSEIIIENKRKKLKYVPHDKQEID